MREQTIEHDEGKVMLSMPRPDVFASEVIGYMRAEDALRWAFAAMRQTLLTMVLLLAGCGERGRAPLSTPTPATPPAAATQSAARPPGVTPVVPFREVSARSGCAMRSLEELCVGLRESYGTYEGAWASDDCALGPRLVTDGPFAEVLLMGIHSGYGGLEGDVRVERPLLGATVRDRPSGEFSIKVLLAARVGEAWFPIHVFAAPIGASDVGLDDFPWELDEGGLHIQWDRHEGFVSRQDPDGWGQVERTVASVSGGVPVIVARAMVERWRNDVDLACTRDCNGAPNPPPHPGCAERCVSRARATRTWQRRGATLHIGASVVERSGPHSEDIDMAIEDAQTVVLDPPSADMRFCAFTPRVHALPRDVPRSDPESTALLEHARALAASHAGHDVGGAAAAADASAPRSIVAIDAQLGGACGGGGCTISLRHRTLEGPFPEDGVSFFQMERGTQAGCDATALPNGHGPTIVEVVAMAAGASVGCGFVGWDGSAERRWVIVRVLEPAAP